MNFLGYLKTNAYLKNVKSNKGFEVFIIFLFYELI